MIAIAGLIPFNVPDEHRWLFDRLAWRLPRPERFAELFDALLVLRDADVTKFLDGIPADSRLPLTREILMAFVGGYDWISMQEAAWWLGIPPTTLRRRAATWGIRFWREAWPEGRAEEYGA